MVMRGAFWLTASRAPVSAFAISPRMCRRPSRAWLSAIFMISSVIEVILMSICSAVMPFVGAGHLEVHVAEMILVAEDVGEHGEAARLP